MCERRRDGFRCDKIRKGFFSAVYGELCLLALLRHVLLFYLRGGVVRRVRVAGIRDRGESFRFVRERFLKNTVG